MLYSGWLLKSRFFSVISQEKSVQRISLSLVLFSSIFRLISSARSSTIIAILHTLSNHGTEARFTKQSKRKLNASLKTGKCNAFEKLLPSLSIYKRSSEKVSRWPEPSLPYTRPSSFLSSHSTSSPLELKTLLSISSSWEGGGCSRAENDEESFVIQRHIIIRMQLSQVTPGFFFSHALLLWLWMHLRVTHPRNGTLLLNQWPPLDFHVKVTHP